MSERTLRFIHVGDSHVRSGEALEGDLRRLRDVVERVRALHVGGVPIDFVVHTGDLVDDADAPDAGPEATRAALDVLDALPVRWFLLNGNHDRRAFLPMGPRPTGHGDVATAGGRGLAGEHVYGIGTHRVADGRGLAVRRIGSLQLLFLDANPEDGKRDVDGAIPPLLVETVADRIDAHAGRTALFVHYPPLAQEALWPGVPEGGEALHEALAARAPRVAGVFVGHSHRGLHHLRDGILYATAPALARQFVLWPEQPEHAVDETPVAGLHYVSLGADGSTRVQHHAFVSGASTP